MNLRSIRKLFSTSPKTYRSVLFWHWGNTPNSRSVESLFESTRAVGIGGVLIDSPPSSHAADYVDDSWLTSLVAVSIRARKQRGSVWLYDDLGSTTSPAKKRRLKEQSSFAQQYIQYVERTVTNETFSELNHLQVVAAFPIEPNTKQQRFSNLDETDFQEGERVGCFVLSVSPDRLRYLHADSVQKYLDSSYTPIQNKTKRFFGNTLGVVLANNAQLISGEFLLPWDDDFIDVFEQTHDYDIRDHLLDLISNTPEGALCRYHYWTLVAALFKEGFSYTLRNWGEERKVPCAGFFAPSTSLGEEIATTGPRMPLYAQQIYPTITLQASDNYPDSLVPIRQLSSVVNQLDTRGAIGLLAPPETPFRLEDWRATTIYHIAMGITYFTLDGAHDTQGLAESTKIPHISPAENAWTLLPKHFDALARLAWMYRRGEASCEVLVLLPTSSIQAEAPLSSTSSVPEHLDTHLRKLSELLLCHQINFDYGDEELLGLHAQADHDTIRMNSQQYSVVLLPPMTTMRSSTYALLQDFAMSGGRLLAVGTVPHLLDGVDTPEVRGFFDEYALKITNGIDLFQYGLVVDTLLDWNCRTIIATTLTGECPTGMLANRRIWEDNEILLITHTHRIAQTIEFSYTTNVLGHVEYWDYTTGSTVAVCECSPDEPFIRTTVWQPQESRTYVFIPTPLEDDFQGEPTLKTERTITPEWTGTRTGANAQTLTECQFPGHVRGNVESARSIMHERLSAMPEGVIARLNWTVPVQIHELECSIWTVSMICPEGGSVRCAGVMLEETKESVIPHPDLRTFKLPTRISAPCDIELEGKWHSSHEIDTPILAGDFSIINGKYESASLVVPLGKWSNAGLANYGGCVTYQAEVQGYERFDSSPIMLEFPGLHSPAEVRVNGKIVDQVLWTPKECDLRPFWTPGPLSIEVDVAGSWFNMLHPDRSQMEQGLETAPIIRIYAQQ